MLEQRLERLHKNTRRIIQLTKVEGKNSKQTIKRIAHEMESEITKMKKEEENKDERKNRSRRHG